MQAMAIIIFVAFGIAIFAMFLKNIYAAKSHWKAYIKEYWNLVDFVIILISLICVGIYVYRNSLVKNLLRHIEESKHNKFVKYFIVIHMEDVLTVVASLLICIATIRLWKLFRFATIFNIMERTITLAARPLIALTICYIIILFMFSFTGYLLFGAYYFDFRRPTKTVTTLILLSIKLCRNFNYDYLEEIRRGFGYTFYIIYVLIMMIVFNMYVSVIVLSYGESSKYYSSLKPHYTVRKYVKEELKYFKALGKKKVKWHLAGGTDNELLIKATPKAYEHRYADSVVISSNKICAMSLVARCVLSNLVKTLQNPFYTTQQEQKLIDKTVYYMFAKSDVPKGREIMFPINNVITTTKFVTDKRILLMEDVVNYILNAGTRENMSKSTFDEGGDFSAPQATHLMQMESFLSILKIISGVFDNIDIQIQHIDE